MTLRNKKKMAICFSAAILFFVLDRFLKILAISNFWQEPKKIFFSFFNFNFIPNYNIAFSLPASGVWLELLISLILLVLIFCLVFLYKKKRFYESLFLFVIILGAVSNLADRIKFGFVIDYLDLKYFTVFNLADAMIVSGAVVLIYYFYLRKN